MRLALGRGSCLIFGERVFEVVAGEVGLEADEFSRFSFFGGGRSSSEGVVVLMVEAGGERWEAALELFGMWMPSSDSETDFRLVL